MEHGAVPSAGGIISLHSASMGTRYMPNTRCLACGVLPCVSQRAAYDRAYAGWTPQCESLKHPAAPISPDCPAELGMEGVLSCAGQGGERLCQRRVGRPGRLRAWERLACSVRLPTALCRLFGLKSTLDRISTDGMLPLSSSLDTVGWFARAPEPLQQIGSILLDASAEGPCPTRRITTLPALACM